MLGAGRLGIRLASLLADRHEVVLVSSKMSKVEQIKVMRRHPAYEALTIHPGVALATKLSAFLDGTTALWVCLPSSTFEPLCKTLSLDAPEGMELMIGTKGIVAAGLPAACARKLFPLHRVRNFSLATFFHLRETKSNLLLFDDDRDLPLQLAGRARLAAARATHDLDLGAIGSQLVNFFHGLCISVLGGGSFHLLLPALLEAWKEAAAYLTGDQPAEHDPALFFHLGDPTNPDFAVGELLGRGTSLPAALRQVPAACEAPRTIRFLAEKLQDKTTFLTAMASILDDPNRARYDVAELIQSR